MHPADSCAKKQFRVKWKRGVMYMKIAGNTDAGLVRPINQDHYAFNYIGNSLLAILCDGMGGANAGDIASVMAVTKIMEEARQNLTDVTDLKEIRNQLRLYMRKVNKEIFDLSSEEKIYQGMGTTIVLAYIIDGRALFMNIGDSRAYLINPSGILRITSDHSMVEEMVKKGHLTEEQARTHPNKNIITMALGPEETILPNSYEQTLSVGDIILLCSDGLSNMLSDEVIHRIVTSNEVERLPDLLIQEANRCGGQDNITAVVIAID